MPGTNIGVSTGADVDLYKTQGAQKPASEGEGASKGVDGKDQGQNTISKSIWSNYDGDRNGSVNHNEANNNSLFSRADIQTNVQTIYSDSVNTQIQKNALKSVDVKGMFQQAVSKFNHNSGTQTKEFKTEAEAKTWADNQAKSMDASVRQAAQTLSQSATQQIQQAFNDAVTAETQKYADMNTVESSGYVEDNPEDKSLESLKGEDNKAKEFDGSTNSTTVKKNEDGSTTETDVKGDDVTTTQNNKDGSKVVTNTQGDIKEVTTTKKDGSQTVETTIKSGDTTEVITENYDKKGRLTSMNRNKTNDAGESNNLTTTFSKNGKQSSRTEVYNNGKGETKANSTQFRKSGSVKSQFNTQTITGADGKQSTAETSVSFRRNGTVSSAEQANFDGSKTTTSERRDGSLKSVEHQRSDGSTLFKSKFSEGGDRLKTRLYGTDGSSMKLDTRMTKSETGETTSHTTIKNYDAKGHMTSKSDVDLSSEGAHVQSTSKQNGEVKTSDNVLSKYDTNNDGKATKADKEIGDAINKAASQVSNLDVGLSGDDLAQFNTQFNASEKYMSKAGGFSESAIAQVAKGEDSSKVLQNLNQNIMQKLTQSISSAVDNVKAEAKSEAAKMNKPEAPKPEENKETKPELNTYTVKAGNTLSQIAQNHGVSLQDLMAVNPQISNPNKINIGQKINLPEGIQAKEGSGNGVAKAKAQTTQNTETQTKTEAPQAQQKSQNAQTKPSIDFSEKNDSTYVHNREIEFQNRQDLADTTGTQAKKSMDLKVKIMANRGKFANDMIGKADLQTLEKFVNGDANITYDMANSAYDRLNKRLNPQVQASFTQG